jgi:hypothetical protein
MYNIMLSKEELLQSVDYEVEGWIDAFIEEHTGIPLFVNTVLNSLNVTNQEFNDPEKAAYYANVVDSRNSHMLSLIEVLKPQSKTGVDSFLTLHKKKVVPFRIACPEDTATIEKVMNLDPLHPRIYVYSIDLTSIPVANRERFKKFLTT